MKFSKNTKQQMQQQKAQKKEKKSDVFCGFWHAQVVKLLRVNKEEAKSL